MISSLGSALSRRTLAGSLALGGAIGVMAILLKAEFLLAIVGGVFVLEVLSVVLQVGYFRYTAAKHGTGRRLFRMAPIHHHFEKLDWPETRIVVRFWVISFLLALLALAARRAALLDAAFARPLHAPQRQ